jgi:hypothetical protein
MPRAKVFVSIQPRCRRKTSARKPGPPPDPQQQRPSSRVGSAAPPDAALDAVRFAHVPRGASVRCHGDRAVGRAFRSRAPPDEAEPLGAAFAAGWSIRGPPVSSGSKVKKYQRKHLKRLETMMHSNWLMALGPDGTYKTGQRVPLTGSWVDQYNVTTTHEAGGTFPPCIGRKGECAFRRPWVQAAATA